ncbi:WbuC family cupin fold metalloprotein [Edwardsiella tarda]|uniref:WbuC family cupin fold metalloprotein n=1 Tax=Edwardsiella tarda TaxID=636 RepID=UPI00351C2AB1
MDFFIFSNKNAESLLLNASCSGRLRAHYNLHTSSDEAVQRVVIGLHNGTYIPPHYHALNSQWELFQVCSGEVDLFIFDMSGFLLKKIPLSTDSGNYFAQIAPNTCHTLVCRSDSALILEIKQGPFDTAKAKVIPEWSYPEEYSLVSREQILTMLGDMREGERFCTPPSL